MREKRMLQNDRLRWAAMAEGLAVGSQVIIRERSLLKDGGYITRMIRRGTVCKLYPYHFYCQMENGQMESFRYNELLGWEARLIRIKGKKENHKKAPEKVLFLRGRRDSNPRAGCPTYQISSRLCHSSENGSCWKIEEVEGSESLEISMFF